LFYFYPKPFPMTLFEKIIAGEIPSYKLAENDLFFAFLDIFPCTEGHTLVVPKVAIDQPFDLPNEYLAGYLPFCQRVAAAIKQAVPCQRVNLLTLGFEVPHAHLHLIPMNGMHDMAKLMQKVNASAEQLQAMQQRICQYL
jgi:histidine triad (HIT) family protein